MTAVARYIRQDTPLSTGSTAVYPWSPELEKEYTFLSRFDDVVKLYHTDGDFIHLPRAVCPIGKEDTRTAGKPAPFPKGPKPRDNQVDVFTETKLFLSEGLSGVVCAQTGWGKTILGYAAAHWTQRKTLVITTKDDIYKQWIADAPKMLGIEPDQIGQIRGDRCDVQGKMFVVAMIHSLSKEGRYPDWIRDEFGLVIFDECHRVPAEQFNTVVSMFPALLRLGLTATIERSDGKEVVVYANIGPVRARTEEESLIPKVMRFTTSWECPRQIKTDKYTGAKSVTRMRHEAGKTTHVEKIVAADPVRNHLICETVKLAYDKGRNIVVFSTLLDHLESLKRGLVQIGVSGKDLGLYVGASTKAEKEYREKVKVRRILLTTYSMMAEGTNLPWLDTCALAMPRSNVIQPVGRVRREYENKKPALVLDFVDNDSPVFAGYASRRHSWYTRIGCEILDF